MSKFIVFTRQRTGSTVLIRSIDRHPNVFCAGEIFHHAKKIYHKEMQFPFIKWIQADLPFLRSGPQIPWGIMRTNSFLQEFYGKTLKENTCSSGFKLMITQTRFFPVTKLWLKNPEIRKIILIRDNALDIIVSKQRAIYTGRAALLPGEKKRKFKITLNTKHLEHQLSKIEKETNTLRIFANNTNSLLIKYDDLLNDWDKTLSSIFVYLSVSPISISPALQKRSGIHLADNINNVEEVESLLKDSPYEKYLKQRMSVN